MNATLNAYRNGLPLKYEAQRNADEGSFTIEITTGDGQTLIVDFEANEQEANIWSGEEYKCKEVYPLAAHYCEGEEVHFNDEEEEIFGDLVRDYFDSQNGDIPYAFHFPAISAEERAELRRKAIESATSYKA